MTTPEQVLRRLAARCVEHARPLVGPPGLHDPPFGLRRTVKVIAQRLVTRVSRPTAALRRLGPPPVFDLVGVYRSKNAEVLAELAAGVSGEVALWSLDEPASPLQDVTVGTGAGTRFTNLNRCVDATPGGRWLVIADDDVALTLGTLPQAVALASSAGLDIAMTSHDFDSFVNWGATRSAPECLVRLTRFVDQGPLIILSPSARERVLPMPEAMGMGWGVEVGWAQMRELRIGIVDAVRMRHLAPVSSGRYDTDAEWARAEQRLADSEWDTWQDLQHAQARWRRGQRTPPWLRRTL